MQQFTIFKLFFLNLRSAGCTIYEIFRFKKAFENPYLFEIPIGSISEYENISDVVLFGYLLVVLNFEINLICLTKKNYIIILECSKEMI